MELEQILKRLEWLDEERRKDKNLIATLEERINQLEGYISPANDQIKTMESEMTRLTSQLARFEQIDAALAQVKVDNARAIEAAEKQHMEREREAEKTRRADFDSLGKTIAELRKRLEPIPELKKGLQARTEEDFRLGRLIEELAHKVDEESRSDEEYRRSLRLIDEGRRQDVKRLMDVQSELAALRKRVDEQRGRMDLSMDAMRKADLRLGEIQSAESERRQAQAAFIEKQNIVFVERERLWKEWQSRFEDITRISLSLESQLQELDTTHRSAKRSQEAFEEITGRFERRVNEITEMQRLVEERFRQEWITFKADDQKRWANYTLAQEEQLREMGRQFEKLSERVVQMEDAEQEMRDTLHQLLEDSQNRMQGLLTLLSQSMDEFERAFGKTR